MPQKETETPQPVVETPEGIGHTLPEGPVGLARDIPTYMPRPELTRADSNGPAAGTRTIETINTHDNRISLGRCDTLKTYFIRFDRNPEEDQGWERHPALQRLEEAGFRLRPLPDSGMAWQKPYGAGAFSMREEMDARNVVRDAANRLGHVVAQGTFL